MKFEYHACDRMLDTNSKEAKEKYETLRKLYKKIPPTKCLVCPGKKGVEADCCKTFSPPLLLVEFMAILDQLEDQTEEEAKDLLFRCHESFLDPGFTKKCVLLEGLLCSVYQARPYSCRMFGVTPHEEWVERLGKKAEETGLPSEEIPFAEQCEGIKIKKKSKIKKISKESSNLIYKAIHDLDISLFEDFYLGEGVVMGSMTYLPFDAHYLSVFIGPESLDILADIKIDLRKSKQSGNEEEYAKKVKNVQEFLEEIKEKIYGGEN